MQLSSSLTPFYKMIFPALWLSGFGVGAFITAIHPDMPTHFRFLMPAAWLFGLLLCTWLCFPLKEVWLGQTSLTIEGLSKTIVIPLAEIESVRGSFATNPEIVTLRLKHAGAFGDRIRFMPSTRFWRFSTHPTVTLLTEKLAREP